MWSCAAVLDSACVAPEPAALAEERKKRQSQQHPSVTAQVSWDSFASIAVWDEEPRHDCVDVELQLHESDLVKTRSAHAITADLVRDECTDAKSAFTMITRSDHALLMCLKVRRSRWCTMHRVVLDNISLCASALNDSFIATTAIVILSS